MDGTQTQKSQLAFQVDQGIVLQNFTDYWKGDIYGSFFSVTISPLIKEKCSIIKVEISSQFKETSFIALLNISWTFLFFRKKGIR